MVEGPEEDIFQAIDLYVITVGMSSQTENTFSSMGLSFGFGGPESFSTQDLGSLEYVDGELSVTTVSFFMGASFKL